MKVMINTEVEPEHLQRIQLVSDDIQIVQPQDNEAQLKEVGDTNVILGGVSRSLFESAQQLKWVQTLGAGVDGVLFPEFVESDVILTSAKGFVGPPSRGSDVGVNPRLAQRYWSCRPRTDLGKPDVHSWRDMGT